MKKSCFSIFLIIFFAFLSEAQNTDSLKTKEWSFSAEGNFYFFPKDFIFLPIVKADKNKLHLEGRYNYEDIGLLSTWAGYNFMGGKKLEYIITPMIGVISGKDYGVAPGLETTFSYKKFELYSETEYLFDLQDKENNFYYVWSDLTYSPKDWFWLGLSAQRTHLFQTDLEIQRGLNLGATYKHWDFSGYLYNIFFSEPFFLFTLSYNY